MKPHTLIALALLAACRSEPIPVELHELASIEYEMPSTWQSIVRDRGARDVIEWTPTSNDQKESISLLHSESLPALAKAGPAALRHYLAQAQGALNGSFGEPVRFTSKHGLLGARVEGSFKPPGESRQYTRTHVAVLSGDRVVHILYTAPLGRVNRDVFEAVIDSLQRKGA